MQERLLMYIDVSLPYPDAKVAAALCVGGAVKYGLRNGCGVSDAFIVEHVTPFIAAKYPFAVAATLGRALLWAIYSEEMSGMIDEGVRERVKAAVAQVVGDRLADGVSPIRKIPLIITGNEGSLTITEMHDDNDDEGNNVRHAVGLMENEVRVILSNVNLLRCKLDEFKNEFNVQQVTTNTLLRKMTNAISRLSQMPQVAAAAGGQEGRQRRTIANNAVGDAPGATGDQGYMTTLSSCPRTLYVLWNEYEVGIGGRKAAKLFNSAERGRVKHKYSLRKVFWDQVIKMIRRGYTAHTAIDKIYEVYTARDSVTNI